MSHKNFKFTPQIQYIKWSIFSLLTRNDSVNEITPALVALYTGVIGSGSKPARDVNKS